MEVESEGVDTLLIGSLPDSAALYGVVAQLERMDLELFEISRLPGDSGHGRQTEDGPNDLERR